MLVVNYDKFEPTQMLIECKCMLVWEPPVRQETIINHTNYDLTFNIKKHTIEINKRLILYYKC